MGRACLHFFNIKICKSECTTECRLARRFDKKVIITSVAERPCSRELLSTVIWDSSLYNLLSRISLQPLTIKIIAKCILSDYIVTRINDFSPSESKYKYIEICETLLFNFVLSLYIVENSFNHYDHSIINWKFYVQHYITRITLKLYNKCM